MKYVDESFRYLKFVTGGGLGLLVNLSVTYLLTEVLGVWFRVAYAAGLGANVIFNFLYHRQVTFNRMGGAMKRLFWFMPLTLGITLANYLLVGLFTGEEFAAFGEPLLGSFYKYAVIIAITTLLSIINYAANRVWVFR